MRQIDLLLASLNYRSMLVNEHIPASNIVTCIMAIVKLRDFTTALTFAITCGRVCGFNNPVM